FCMCLILKNSTKPGEPFRESAHSMKFTLSPKWHQQPATKTHKYAPTQYNFMYASQPNQAKVEISLVLHTGHSHLDLGSLRRVLYALSNIKAATFNYFLLSSQ